MLKKLVIAGAMVTAAAGMGLATPAYASDGDHLVEKTCIGPTFGEKEHTLSKGSDLLLSGIALVGESEKDLMHQENKLEFEYSCGNGPIAHIGNKLVDIKADKNDDRGRWGR